MKSWLAVPFVVLVVLGQGSAPAPAQDKPAAEVRAAPVVEAPRSSNYRLSPSDVLAIKVFREPDLDSQRRISKDGTIDFPLIGTVRIAGKTTTEAAGAIAALLDKDYLVRPQVAVDVVTYSKERFTVVGSVTTSGTFSIPEEQSMNLTQAVAAAGGFTRLADLSKVIVQRQSGETFNVDARPGKKDAQNVQILPNDVITVKERLF